MDFVDKEKLRDNVTSLVAFRDNVQSVVNELEEMCRNTEENYRTQKQSVCDKFSNMLSILEHQHKVMIQQISSEEEQKLSETQMLIRCCGESVEANRRLLESAESSMDDMEMAAFVKSSRKLITTVMAASSSCPAETLKPSFEHKSFYKINFSRQEKALKSIDFIKVVEDVPEELEGSPEPEEPKVSLIQSTELEQYQEPSVKDLDIAEEPAQEWIPAPLCPLVKPVQPTEQKVASVPAVLPVERDTDTVESDWELMQLDTHEPDSNVEEPGHINVETREETKKAVEAPYPIKVGNSSDNQEGISMQQAVMLFFYLVAFLVILQRIWAYIGCFICA
ncbi:tripartite motif-containing protein 55-like [Nematolebias whitei]|uniref:tripartite motif-containing protein 55-like n=1 Tax=Nematolebias whitei TaxID=451745 RepID=UPI001897FF78|nr:tripartite motif-containing protein 55-like [Nematolebias whitei]